MTEITDTLFHFLEDDFRADRTEIEQAVLRGMLPRAAMAMPVQQLGHVRAPASSTGDVVRRPALKSARA